LIQNIDLYIRKVFVLKLNMITPAAETKSIGLPADALVVKVFASPSGQLYRDKTTFAHLSGLGTVKTVSS